MSTYAQSDVLTAAPRRADGNQQTNGRTAGIDQEQIARFLGWFSIGLGVAELVMPAAVAKLVGTRNHRGLIRFYGMREIAAGVGILTKPRPAGWLWARVGGDVIDLASLGSALGSRRNNRGKTVGAIAAVAGVTALDVVCAQRMTAQAGGGTERAEASIIVNKSPEECYRFWHEFENFPRFMSYVRSVQITGENRSHWVARMPGGAGNLEWNAEMVDDVPNERISWRSLSGSDIFNTGSVQFQEAAGSRGTVIRVQLEFGHPAASIVAPLARLIGKHPEQMVEKDLRRFKQVIETGEAITTEGQPAGRRSGMNWLDSMAR
jgi:uncharacterized membrane protein